MQFTIATPFDLRRASRAWEWSRAGTYVDEPHEPHPPSASCLAAQHNKAPAFGNIVFHLNFRHNNGRFLVQKW